MLGFFSCQQEEVFDHYEQLIKDVQAIDKYLAENNITAIKDSRGIRLEIKELGTGLPASVFNTVNVDYVGKLLTTGETFDNGNTTEVLNNYITGWQIALSSLPAGSKANLYIPSGYAYGNASQAAIPANSNLIFDIDFKGVILTSAERTRFTNDTTAIDTYLAGKNVSAVTDSTGVRYVVTSPGSGPPPTWYQPLKLKYTIREMTNDSRVAATVDASPSSGFDSRMVNYFPGMMVGLQKIGEGGKVTLYIPSNLAFGTPGVVSNNTQVIQPNSNLIVEVELTDIL